MKKEAIKQAQRTDSASEPAQAALEIPPLPTAEEIRDLVRKSHETL